MGQVNVSINGRQFRMACEDGQEEHLTRLAKDLDVRIGDLRSKFGEIGDNRLTIMAALTIADELLDVNQKLAQIEAEITALRSEKTAASDQAQRMQSDVVAAFTTAAERIETIARHLSQTGAPNRIALG